MKKTSAITKNEQVKDNLKGCEKFNFFALLNRLKLIPRWSLMHNRIKESVCEHSYQAAIVAHALAIIDNKIMGKKTNAEMVATISLFHDVSEVLTGDMPTPIKYSSKALENAYKETEENARLTLLKGIPEEFLCEYKKMLYPDKKSREYQLLKFADKICAYIKCVEEVTAGNKEFLIAKASIKQKIEDFCDKTVDYFLEKFMPAFGENLDNIF